MKQSRNRKSGNDQAVDKLEIDRSLLGSKLVASQGSSKVARMMFTRGGRASLTTLRSGMVPQGSRGMAKLAHEIIRSDKAPEDSSEPRKTAIVMHGILVR